MSRIGPSSSMAARFAGYVQSANITRPSTVTRGKSNVMAQPSANNTPASTAIAIIVGAARGSRPNRAAFTPGALIAWAKSAPDAPAGWPAPADTRFCDLVLKDGRGITGSPSSSGMLAKARAGAVPAADNLVRPGRFASGSKLPDDEQVML